jgi:hypothetical protein
MKSKSDNTQVERSKCLLCNQRQTYGVDFFLMALFTRKACRGISVAGGGVSPANGAVPATAMVMAAAADGAISSSSGSAREEEAEGLQEDSVSMTQYQHIAIQQGNNKYPEDSISCAFRFRTIQRPCGTSGKASANSTTGSRICSVVLLLQLPPPPRGSHPLWTHYCAELQLCEPFWLLQRRWGGGGPAGANRVIAGSCGIVLCVPAEGSQLAMA